MNTHHPPERAYIHLDPENQEWLNARTAWILQEFGADPIRSCEMILPNSPLLGQYRGGTDEEVFEFFARVAQAMGLDAERIDFELSRDLKGDDGTRALGLYQEIDGRFWICIDESQLETPSELLATLVHELCHVHLMGYGRLSGDEADNEPLTDLLGVFFGYGIILANSVVYDQPLQLGPFYESQMGRRGYLTMPMFGYALALLWRLRGEDGSDWKRHMRLDVRDAFIKILRYFDRNGLPDLSSVPTSFGTPRIELEHADDSAAVPERRLPFYPHDYEAEEPEEERDFAIDSDAADLDDRPELSCRYCGAVVNLGPEESICRACQDSIDEGEQELKELRAADEQYKGIQSSFFTGVLVFTAALISLMFLWKCSVWLVGAN